MVSNYGNMKNKANKIITPRAIPLIFEWGRRSEFAHFTQRSNEGLLL